MKISRNLNFLGLITAHALADANSIRIRAQIPKFSTQSRVAANVQLSLVEIAMKCKSKEILGIFLIIF